MWTDVLQSTSWLLVWFLAATLAYFCIQWVPIKETSWIKSPRHYVLLPLMVALLVRLIPAVFLPVGAGYDIESFRLVAEALLAGKDVYTSAAVGRHPYLPFQVYSIGFSLYLAQHTVFPFVVWVKLLPIISDVAITGIIYVAAQKMGRGQRTAVFLAMLYALNPISILVSAYHGQFDSIPVLLLLLAWYFWHFEQKIVISALFLGFAVLDKTWPIVFLPIVFLRMQTWKVRFQYVFLVLGIPVLFTLAYIYLFSADPSPMLKRALTHAGPPGYWGPASILAVLGNVNARVQEGYVSFVSINRWVIVVVGMISLWFTRKDSTLNALLTIILCVFMVSAGMGMQWLLWVIPFALLAHDIRWLNIYSLTGTVYLLAHLYGYHMYPWANEFLSPQAVNVFLRLTALPVWIVVVMWASSRLFRTIRMQKTTVFQANNS